MKNKFLKALSTITLSLVLATAAIAGTALAAENWVLEKDCDHFVQMEEYGIAYDPANSMYHWATPYLKVTCNECKTILVDKKFDEQTVYEEHDLIGSADGYYWVCIYCDAHIIAGTK